MGYSDLPSRSLIGERQKFFTYCLFVKETFSFWQGLVVPVIRNVEEMNYADIEKAINAMGEKVCKRFNERILANRFS